jgi:predicted ATPase
MPSPAKPASHNLPRQITPFIGRQAELDDLTQRLADPACFLLTLVGPGGVGKTRLATETAAAQLNTFAHGTCFVPLQAAETVEMLVTALVDVLDIPLQSQQSPRSQVLDYLSNKELLLVLDNFEQLLPSGGADLVADILAEAIRVKLLVTSREVLNLQEEWLYHVRGLPFPPPGQTPDNLEAYDAVQLFTERARRVRPDFSPAAELAHLIRICQLVEGMPLAIELAASWRCSASSPRA